MRVSVNFPVPGHDPTVHWFSRGRANIAGFNTPTRGTFLQCSCGWTTRTNNCPPSRGGRAWANAEYRRHIKAVTPR